jgi:hypothetical protein
MTTLITITLTAYTFGITSLAYLFCYGDPGTLGGLLPFLTFAVAIPFTSAMTYCAVGGGRDHE